MTNNMGKSAAVAKRKSHTLPPLEGGTQATTPSSCLSYSPPATTEGRRRTRSMDPAQLPTLEPPAGGGIWPAPQRAISVESVSGGRPAVSTSPSSPRREPHVRARAGSFRLKDGLQHKQPRATEPEEPIAAPRGGKPLNLQPIDTRRTT
ncbi:uncharacterized protein LOC122393373 [Amphibalanus amphitrite]|uniref:uncharacterized protein LOC122393373 n=1 Tax=Amphibalanus amphitrite TaxID=1232801 RepID=UPI001C9004D0|nr:uncharacterized protein LOC122393373 [Amphibalanus amphitrite]XP_043245256.1 uncharacterized protein LOC122393373 [Amphibalanus amphitrite]